MDNSSSANIEAEPYWSLSDGITMASGLSVKIERFSLESTMVLPFELQDSPLFFGFQVAGSVRSNFCHGQQKRAMEFVPGSNGIGYYPEVAGTLEYMHAKDNCSVTILVRPELLARYLEYEAQSPPREFVNVLETRRGAGFFRLLDNTPTKQMLLRRILEYAHSRTYKMMFLEATCLELVALQLEECIRGDSPHPRVALSPSDVERIRAARDLLVSNLDDPPTTLELARQVGINDFKLKQGFREVFGNTLFGYFRDYRLDKARSRLDEGEMNVSAAAYSVGYVNLSHFSKAFHRKFGVKPKEYLRSRSLRSN